MKTIPTHEPEVLAAGARRYRGDMEKVRTTIVDSLVVHGVHLSSRYDKAHELERMRTMVEAVSVGARAFLESIFCDSQAGACYSVTFKSGTRVDIADWVLDQLEEASDGHNGISVHGTKAEHRDPHWPGDEML